MRAYLSRPTWSEAAVRAVVGYAVLAILAIGLAFALRDGVPWVHPEPWLVAPLGVALASSTMLGLTAALVIIGFTRVAVRRFTWARRLHAELRPVASDLTDGQILLVAGLSGLGEEVFFRGLLAPVAGVVVSAVVFGLVHQMKMRGPSRWVWTGWAIVVGLMLGSLFALTGSLVGPLLAHAVVNAANLTYLRDHDAPYPAAP
jgi:membrane protease YdiL (CAAX protease family)